MADQELTALEQRWEDRVRHAKLHLDLCRLHVKQMKALAADIPPSDGGYAFKKALQSERYALVEYTRTLRVYSDLVVYRRVPEGTS